MKKRKGSADRKVWQEKRRAQRRYPFKPNTRILDLLWPKAYGDLDTLIKQLAPYLQEEVRVTKATRLYFNLERIDGVRKNVYKELAEFLLKVNSKDALKISTSAFFRYLSSPDHCNLGVSEESLKALITRAMKAPD